MQTRSVRKSSNSISVRFFPPGANFQMLVSVNRKLKQKSCVCVHLFVCMKIEVFPQFGRVRVPLCVEFCDVPRSERAPPPSGAHDLPSHEMHGDLLVLRRPAVDRSLSFLFNFTPARCREFYPPARAQNLRSLRNKKVAKKT